MGSLSEEGPTGRSGDGREIIVEGDWDDEPSIDLHGLLSGYIKDKKGPPIALAVVAVVVLIIVASQGSDKDGPTITAADSSDLSSSPEVIYEVQGTTDQADITYQTPTGTEQQTGVDVASTGRIRLTFPGRPSFLSISAQNKNNSGEVTCRIVAGGQVLSETPPTAHTPSPSATPDDCPC